ncbi:M20 aminoacylase family protein [Inhella gelatinilytica]|uniref:Amidohydrolase n=1 Tax=Inhella gelatinilytica TaxID=2795030 RepID=A0A931IUR9_9BURK|nr:M20 aminoacylase family protein [Inhella gelatinilytica]MBH9551369.1 amidohydrolase [Inhella gelatinilytica]
MKLLTPLLDAQADLVRIRRDIHQHPELCFQEQRTSDLIAKQLEAWGLPVIRGLGQTGVVGVVKGGDSPRAVGLRADIDALPMTEHNHFPHASVHAGKMHACGHDGHTTMLLAAAKHLAEHRNFDGTVYLIFQPAEEGGGGAREMIKDGLWQQCPMDAVFGIHNWPGMPAGTFSLASGPVFASSNEFKIVLKGKGAHGAMPHLGLDPVPAACQLVQAFQTIINRNKRPIDTGVISVTMIHAGEATNVIPEAVTLEGTVRTFTVEVLDLIERRMKELSEHLAAGFELQCEFQFRRNYPPTVNHARETEFVRRTLTAMGAKVEHFEPTMGAEDFSYYLLDKPGCYFLIGNGEGQHREGGHGLGPCTLHNPSYDFNDHLIPVGGSMWVQLVEAWFKEQQA